ncbi:unnamed protein product [Adineta ricciae]|uniref:Uncharacterized protein n=1 Tax=Adineta ricciae TaxID=249248 RepID=A0A815DP01_ADIRI|nr:unnamed protein product [Adineta ricciae]
MDDNTKFVQTMPATKRNVEALSQVKCEQKTKRDKAYQAVDAAEQNGESRAVVKNLKLKAEDQELKFAVCSLVTEWTAQQRDKALLAARKKLKVVADNVTKDGKVVSHGT